jgi:hypothetical protein
MKRREYASRLDELDALLNDPDVPIEPNRVWELLAEVKADSRDSQTGGSAITSE